MTMQALAPITLFCYNRPEHLRRTVEALQKNELAAESELIIYSDGPKTDADAAKVNAVREYIRTISGFKSLKINASPANKGLASSVIYGVTEIVNQYGRIIVLEDDIVTSPFFLQYMNDALDFYSDNKMVMHISGYMYPVNANNLPKCFFLRVGTCWGWGTWKRAWQNYEKDVNAAIEWFDDKQKYIFNLRNAYNYFHQLEANKNREIDTWAIFWYFTIFRLNGLSLHPAISLTKNIGFDETGTNCGIFHRYDVDMNQYAVTIPDFPQKPELNRRAEKELALFFQYPVNPSKRGKIKSIFQLPGRLCRMLTDFILSSFNDLRMRCRCLLIKTLLALSNRRGKCIKLAGYKIKYTDSASLGMDYKNIFINKIYDFKTDNLRPFIIDGGGCIGVSVLYFKRIYPESQIIVFEPDSEISSILRFNLENNNIQDVTVIESELSETDGECSFLPDGVDGGKIAPASTKGLDASQLKTIKLEKLSKYITQPVDFLKLNIEGQELAVLAELEQHEKLRLIEKMVIEYHGWTEEKQKLGDILNLLDRNGFRYMLHDFDSETNSSSKPPFSPLPERTWFCLIAAAGKK